MRQLRFFSFGVLLFVLSLSELFCVVPVVSSVSPSSGPTTGGNTVTITGTAFTGTTSVLFGETSASFIVDSDTTITATAPVHAIGVTDVFVTTPGGESTPSMNDHYTYLVIPEVLSVSPNFGPTIGSTSVTITGTHFTGATQVLFGSVSASFVVASDTSIIAVAPEQAVGTVDVRVSSNSGESFVTVDDQYTYQTTTVLPATKFVGSIIKDLIKVKGRKKIRLSLDSSWVASISSGVVSYEVFANNELIATIPSSEALTFAKKLRPKAFFKRHLKKYGHFLHKKYKVRAVNAIGAKSPFIYIKIKVKNK